MIIVAANEDQFAGWTDDAACTGKCETKRSHSRILVPYCPADPLHPYARRVLELPTCYGRIDFAGVVPAVEEVIAGSDPLHPVVVVYAKNSRLDAEIGNGLKTTAGYYPNFNLGDLTLDLKVPLRDTTSTKLSAMRHNTMVLENMFGAHVFVIHGPEITMGLEKRFPTFDVPVPVIHGPECLRWDIEDLAAARVMERAMERIYQANTLACIAPPATAFGNMVANPGGAPVFKNRFILDSGASFHAVGDARMLRGIQLYSFGMWVTLPDGSRLRIVGVGTLQMDDPSVCGNHVRSYSIPNVRLVAGLQKNLISVSQLDVDHGLCCSFHSKKCEIMMADGTVTGGAILEEEDGMYVLRFLEVQ